MCCSGVLTAVLLACSATPVTDKCQPGMEKFVNNFTATVYVSGIARRILLCFRTVQLQMNIMNFADSWANDSRTVNAKVVGYTPITSTIFSFKIGNLSLQHFSLFNTNVH